MTKEITGKEFYDKLVDKLTDMKKSEVEEMLTYEDRVATFLSLIKQPWMEYSAGSLPDKQIRKGTFMQRSQVHLAAWVRLIYMRLRDPLMSIKRLRLEIGVADMTARSMIDKLDKAAKPEDNAPEKKPLPREKKVNMGVVDDVHTTQGATAKESNFNAEEIKRAMDQLLEIRGDDPVIMVPLHASQLADYLAWVRITDRQKRITLLKEFSDSALQALREEISNV